MQPRQHCYLSSEDFRAAMKAAQEAAKAAKAPAKERKNNIFQIFKKASVSTTFFYAHNFL
jgi:hypothetical protein